MKKRAVVLDVGRNGYSQEQVEEYYGTMSVKELIERLRQFDEDDLVFFRNDNGYTYGYIDEDKVYTEKYEIDE